MNKEHLTTYLNDHLAGSVAALELLDHLSETHAGKPLGEFAAGLRGEVAEDQEVLPELLKTLGARESGVRQAAAWLLEKFAEVRLRLAGPSGGAFGQLEALETLLLGIEGKHALWRALAAASETVPALRTLDFPRLEQRATEQRERVESRRLAAARLAFTETDGTRGAS